MSIVCNDSNVCLFEFISFVKLDVSKNISRKLRFTEIMESSVTLCKKNVGMATTLPIILDCNIDVFEFDVLKRVSCLHEGVANITGRRSAELLSRNQTTLLQRLQWQFYATLVVDEQSLVVPQI